MNKEQVIHFIRTVKDMREKQKAYFESRKKVGNNKHLLEEAVKAEMDVDGLIWQLEKELELDDSSEDPIASLF